MNQPLRRLLGKAGIDPIPREIVDGDRRSPGGGRRRESQDRDVADDEVGAAGCQVSRFCVRLLVQLGMERLGTSDALYFVDPKSVDLHHACITLHLREVRRPTERVVEDPPGCRRPNSYLQVRALPPEGSNELDAARGVAEAVPGDIKNNAI